MLEEVKLYEGGMKAFIKVRKLCVPQIKELIAVLKWERPDNHNAQTTPECLAR